MTIHVQILIGLLIRLLLSNVIDNNIVIDNNMSTPSSPQW